MISAYVRLVAHDMTGGPSTDRLGTICSPDVDKLVSCGIS